MVDIGYVGPLSAAHNVRLLHTLEAELDAEGLDVRFTIVGDGRERRWLERHMLRAEFTGPLRGEALAQAYAQMDVLALPWTTNAGGSVFLEAMASGVPLVVMAGGGPTFLGELGRTAIVATTRDEFINGVRNLVRHRGRREAMGAAARACARDLLAWPAPADL